MNATREGADVSKALDRMRKSRAIDTEGAQALVSLGWKQVGVLEGLAWCPVCSQPTVWKDNSGTPTHLWCSDLAGGAQ